MREDRGTIDRLARYGTRPIEYEQGLAVARRIRASRYLGASFQSANFFLATTYLTRFRMLGKTQSGSD